MSDFRRFCIAFAIVHNATLAFIWIESGSLVGALKAGPDLLGVTGFWAATFVACFKGRAA